jgi:hypothetical protein
VASTASRDIVVRFVGDTGSLTKATDQASTRLRGVATNLQGIAKLGAVVGAVSFFKSAIDEAREAERTTRQTEAVLRSTGNAAGVSAKQIGDLANSLSEKVGVDDEVIQHGENVLLTFRNIRNEAGRGNDIFNQTTKVALDMSAALSESGDASEGLQSNTIKLGKALNDPIAGISALTKVGVSFTAQQKAQIKALVEQGDTLGAQKLILSELNAEFGGMAAASADSIGKAQVSWKNFAEEVGQRVMPAVNAVSNWALHTGLPALGHVASVVGDAVTPAFQGLVNVGSGVVHTWQSLPGPIQAGAIALGAWMLVGSKVEGFFGRVGGPIRNFGTEVQAVMTASQGAVGRFGASLQVMQDRVPFIGKMGAAFRTAKGDVGGFGSTLRGVAAAGFSGLRSAAGGLMGLLGGPWGLAITGATALISFFAGKSAEAEKRQQDLADAGAHVAQVLRDQKGAYNQSARDAAAKEAEDQGLLQKAQQLGISLPMVTSAVLQQGDALMVVRDNLKQVIAAETIHQAVGGKGGQGAVTRLTAEGQAAQNMLNDLNALIAGKDRDTASDKRRGEAAQGVASSQMSALPANDAYKAAIEATGAEFQQGADQAQQLVDGIKQIMDEQTNSIETEEAYQSSLRNLTEAIRQNGNTLDIHTQKGQANRDALEDVATKIRDTTLADIQSGVPMNQSLARHNQRINALRQEAIKTFGAKSEAVRLINTYGNIPKNVMTKLKAVGYSEINAQLLDLSAKQTALAHGVTIGSKGYASYVRQINQEKKFQHGSGMASGGEVSGPGGPTSDSVPIWASAGEFMQRAAAVKHYGLPFMNALNRKQIPRDLVQSLAGGGMVWPFNVDLRKTKIPTPPVVPVAGAAAGSPAVVAAVRAVASRFGWGSGYQWNSLSQLIAHESGWNPNAANPTSSARGLFQKLTSMNGPIEGTVAGQAMWGLSYIRGRYGSPGNAWAAWLSRSPHWYDNGGSLRPGVSTVVNNTGRPEQVLTPAERDAYVSLGKAAAAGMGGNVTKILNVGGIHVTNRPTDVIQQIRRLELLEGMS